MNRVGCYWPLVRLEFLVVGPWAAQFGSCVRCNGLQILLLEGPTMISFPDGKRKGKPAATVGIIAL